MHKYFLITIILGVSLCKCQTTLSFEKFPKQVFDGSAADHSIQRTKRSTCDLSQSTTDKINSSISQHAFANDPNESILLAWADKNILVVTFNYAGIPEGYLSKNRGKSFDKITNQFHGQRIASSGLETFPLDSKKVILFAAPEFFKYTSTLLISTDAAETFTKVDLHFKYKAGTLQFNPFSDERLLILSEENELYMSEDSGFTWSLVSSNVKKFSWCTISKDTFYYLYDPTHQNNDKSIDNQLYRGKVGSSKHSIVATDVRGYLNNDNYLLVSDQFCGKNGSRVLYVSKNQGDTFSAAQLKMISDDEFYAIIDISEEQVMIHVDGSGDSGKGTLYTSDDRGMIYSKSLEDHLYPNGGSHDVYRVESLNGTYITSKLLDDQSVASLITHDKGMTWNKIDPPKEARCKNSETECKLHIHNAFSKSKSVKTRLPLSHKNAVGIVLAHANVGDGLTVAPPSVYMSNDGGYTWLKPAQLKDGPHFYGILDSGGVVYAIPMSNDPQNTIWFSFDEGDCWHSHKFSDDKFVVTGVMNEPGHQTADITIWGYSYNMSGSPWVAIFVDFSRDIEEKCKPNDYENWQAHNGECVLGSKTIYKRRVQGSTCQNSADQLDLNKAEFQPCTCQLHDFSCDYGFKKNSKGECVETGQSKDVCINNEEYIVSSKYRKVPGDKCTGGSVETSAPILKTKNCDVFNYTENGDISKFPNCFNNPSVTADPHKRISNESGNSNGVVIFLVLTVAVLLVALSILAYYKRESLMRVRYNNLLDDDELLISDNNQPAQQQSEQKLVVAAGLPNNGGIQSGDVMVIQPPLNLPNPTNFSGVSSSDLGRPGDVSAYHDDSDEDLITT